MIDTSVEQAISLNKARRLPALQRDGRSPDLCTVYRWISRGIGGVKLESVKVAGSRCTTAEAIGRFLADLNRTAGPEGPVYRTPTRREREIQEAERELEAAA